MINITEKMKWQRIREISASLLSACDWTQLPDARITPAKKAEWDAYRELLATIETRFVSPDDVVIPDVPVDERTADAPVEIAYTVPVHAPDFVVSSPKPKTDPAQAHAEAIAESLKADKSIALIVLDLVVYITELEQRLKRKNI